MNDFLISFELQVTIPVWSHTLNPPTLLQPKSDNSRMHLFFWSSYSKLQSHWLHIDAPMLPSWTVVSQKSCHSPNMQPFLMVLWCDTSSQATVFTLLFSHGLPILQCGHPPYSLPGLTSCSRSVVSVVPMSLKHVHLSYFASTNTFRTELFRTGRNKKITEMKGRQEEKKKYIYWSFLLNILWKQRDTEPSDFTRGRGSPQMPAFVWIVQSVHYCKVINY